MLQCLEFVLFSLRVVCKQLLSSLKQKKNGLLIHLYISLSVAHIAIAILGPYKLRFFVDASHVR